MIRRFFIVIAVILGFGWLGDAWLGNVPGRFAAAHFGSTLEHLGASKVPDAAEFVSARVREGLWLVSLAWIGCVPIAALCRRFANADSRLFPWVAGIGLFFALNIWCLLAGQTTLFWLILRGTSVENQAQFRAKENLLREVNIHPRLALVGSSQSQAQFTEEIFNANVAGKAWMMELHFPGSLAEDAFFVGERFGPKDVEGFVYYVSLTQIYAKNHDSSSARDLLRLRDLPESLAIGAWSHFQPITARYAALGMVLPLFQYRASFQHALLGSAALEPKIQAAPAVGPVDTSYGYDFGPETDFQKAAFRRFMEHSARKGQRVIVIGGQMNPEFETKLSPAVRQDFEKFLKECAAAYPNITLVWQNELLVQPPDAYVDHVHVTPAVSEKFTAAFAKWYEEQKW
jgi:hypothetical protein